MVCRSPTEVAVETFADTLESLTSFGPRGIDRFSASLPEGWIEEALAATGTGSIRRRKLPAEQAVWLVLGMSLFTDRSIRNVTEHLGLVLPGVTSLAPSAVSQARERLGPAPMEWLFERVASMWSNKGGEKGYAGMSLFAVDGTCMRVQDSDSNFEHFGKPGGPAGSGDAGYPQLRLACLMNLGTRMLVAARFGAYRTSELELADALWDSVPPNSITILDRGFVDYLLLASFLGTAQKRHLLVRMRDNMNPEAIEELSDGTLKVRLVATNTACAKQPDVERTIEGRIIAYKHPDGKACRLFTTLMDVDKYPANELIELYHQRWEIELAYDELKTHMLDRKECLRCKSPRMVEQELWGLLLTYNLVRREMLLVADSHKTSPARISFVSSLMWITNFWLISAQTSPSNLPRHLGEFHSKLGTLILPERRSERRYPRHIKIYRNAYPRNRGKRALVTDESAK